MTPPRDARHILLVENDREEFERIVRSLRNAGLLNPIVHCTEVGEAIAYLWRASSDRWRTPWPAVVLLDGALASRGGETALLELRRVPAAANLPVILLASPEEEAPLGSGLQAPVLRKPLDPDRFLDALRRLRDYWFEVVLVPREAPLSSSPG